MKILKKSIYYSFLCLALIVSSCSSSDDDGTGGDDGSGTSGDEFLTAKVDGADYAAAQDPAVIVGAQIAGSILIFQGGTNEGVTIQGTINGYNGVGTYTTGDDITNTNSLNYITVTPVALWGSTFNIGSGTIEITSDDGTTIEGTFSFEGFNASDSTTKTITNGSFKAILDN